MKPVHLNQLLFHSKVDSLSIFYQSLDQNSEEHLENFLHEIELHLEINGKEGLSQILKKNESKIHKIIRSHKDKSHGFFLTENLQGYVILENSMDSYYTSGDQFHVRPLLEELFTNPEFLLVNVSLYDIKVYRGDFQHVEIIQQFEFDQMSKSENSPFYVPQHMGLIPYKTILVMKRIAQKIKDLILYHSLPVIVTGLEEMKDLFMRYFENASGLITQVQEDFYEKTCVQISERCRQFRHLVMDFYSSQLKDKLKQLMKSRRILTDLGEILIALKEGRVIHMILPMEKKLWGSLNLETGVYEIHKNKRGPSIDILNELAEEMMKQGGRIQILKPHFFPQEAHVLAILKG